MPVSGQRNHKHKISSTPLYPYALNQWYGHSDSFPKQTPSFSSHRAADGKICIVLDAALTWTNKNHQNGPKCYGDSCRVRRLYRPDRRCDHHGAADVESDGIHRREHHRDGDPLGRLVDELLPTGQHQDAVQGVRLPFVPAPRAPGSQRPDVLLCGLVRVGTLCRSGRTAVYFLFPG